MGHDRPIPPNEDERSLSALFVRFMVALVALFSAFELFGALADPPNAPRYGITIVIIAATGLGCIPVARRGSLRTAAFVFSLLIWATISANILLGEGITSPGIVGYALVILVAGVFAGQRTAIMVAALAIAWLVMLALLFPAGLGGAKHSVSLLARLAIYAFFVVIYTVFQGLASTRIRDSLARARSELEERRKAETALRESEERLTYLAEATFEGLGITENGVFLESNVQLAQMLGREVSELIGRSVLDFIAPQSREAALRNAGPDEALFEQFVLRKDGSTFPVEIQRRAMTYLGRKVRVIAVRDLTERKRAEQVLAENERRYSRLVESIRDVLFALRADGTIRLLNAAFERTLGWSRDEWIGRPYDELLHSEDRRDARAHIERTLSGEGENLHEVRFRTRDGGTVTGEVLLIPQIESQRVVGLLGMARDVTERKALEQRVERSRRLESVGAMANGIAHDLTNLLTPILLSAQALGSRAGDPASAAALETLIANARRGREILRQVSMFARGSSVERDRVQLKYVIDAAVTMMRENLPRTAAIGATVPDDLLPISANAAQLNQLLLELYAPAGDAPPAAGIQLAARNLFVADAERADFPELRVGSWVELAISARAAPGPARSGAPGTGGIDRLRDAGTPVPATVREIVGAHGGAIRSTTTADGGWVVTCYFPAFVAGPSASSGGAVAPAPTGSGELVLIVDDELSVLTMMKETVEAFGYRALGVSDAAGALAIFAVERPEPVRLVVCTQSLPGMGAAQVLKVLRRLDPRLRVIVMTDPLDSNAPAAQPIAANGYLAKPFDGAQLAEAVTAALAEPRRPDVES